MPHTGWPKRKPLFWLFTSGVMSWRDSSLRSCCRVCTIVTLYLPDSQRLHWRHYSGYCTLPLELSWTSDHACMCLPPCVNCTGCRSSRGSSSSCACSSTSGSFTSTHKWPANVCCRRTWTTRPPNGEPWRFHRATDKSEVRRQHSVSPLHETASWPQTVAFDADIQAPY